eukprot:358981-Rhodomonas_salina.2
MKTWVVTSTIASPARRLSGACHNPHHVSRNTEKCHDKRVVPDRYTSQKPSAATAQVRTTRFKAAPTHPGPLFLSLSHPEALLLSLSLSLLRPLLFAFTPSLAEEIAQERQRESSAQRVLPE